MRVLWDFGSSGCQDSVKGSSQGSVRVLIKGV